VKRILCLLFLLSFLTAGKNSVLLLIPGIQQLKEGKYLKGFLLSAGFASCVGMALWKNSQGYEYYDLYLKATVVEDVIRYREMTEEKFRERNYFIAAAAGIWLIHLIDLRTSNKKGVSLDAWVSQNFTAFRLSFNF